MRHIIAAAALVLGMAMLSATLTASGQAPLGAASAFSVNGDNAAPVINRYCVACHSARLQTAGLSLEGADLAQVDRHPETWEKVVRKLRTRSMPPATAARPDEATYEGLASWLEGKLDRDAAANVRPGRSLVHRLNRVEYAVLSRPQRWIWWGGSWARDRTTGRHRTRRHADD